MDNRYSK